MNFSVTNGTQILASTPRVLDAMLSGLDESWTKANEGSDTWTPFDVVGHLIHGEKTDWIPRMHIFLSNAAERKLVPFDMSAQFRDNIGKTMQQLLAEFEVLRTTNVAALKSANLDADMLAKTALHPQLGTVTLAQHLSTWVAHDLDHVMQISRVMAKRYKEDVGPWVQFLRILRA